MENTVLNLNIDQCQKVRALSGTKPYKNTKEGSRYEGKSYRTFLYGAKGFNLPEDDQFCKDYDADNVYEIELEETEEGYNFISHRSISRAMAAHKTTVTMKAFTVQFVQSSMQFNPEELVD